LVQSVPRPALLCFVLVSAASLALADARQDCFKKSGEPAIRACSEAIARDPADAISYVNRAFEYQQKSDHAGAIADYSRAITLDPNRWDALQGRAWVYLKMGRPAKALLDVERSLQLNPSQAQTLDTRGHILEALGRREDAIADFRRALAIEPRLQGSRDGLKRLGASP
jgi:tetratricopeptide (TPR) repeat protein